MEKRSQLIWFFFACALCLCYSRTTAAINLQSGWPTWAYYVLTAGLVAAALLAVYLPCAMLASRFRWDPWKGVGTEKAKRYGLCLLAASLAALAAIRFGTAQAADAGQGPALFWGSLLLQLGSALLFFFGIRAFSNVVCALFAVLSIALLPPCALAAGSGLRPDLILFAGALLLGLNAFVWRRRERRGEGGCPVWIALAGAVSGAVAVFEPRLACVGLLMLSALIFKRGRDRKPADIALYAGLFFGTWLLSAAVWLLVTGQGSLLAGAAALRQELIRTFAASRGGSGGEERRLSGDWMTVPVFLLAFLTLFGQMPEEEEKSSLPWLAPYVWLVAADLIAGAGLREQGLQFVFLAVLAGHGSLQILCMPAQESDARQEQEKEPQEQEEAVEEQREEQVEKQEGNGAPVRTPRPGEPLPNPLPVPERRARRGMDYALEPAPERMCYDILPSEGDDFDR